MVRIACACAAILGSAWVGACLRDNPIAGPRITDTTVTVLAPIVSNPVAAAAATSAAAFSVAGGSSGTDVVYVSLPPGTIPDGGLATVRNTRTGTSASAAMASGGFDPVAIEASAGDTLALQVQRAEGGSPVTFSLVVLAPRRPVVVRTDPPPRKRDVPLNTQIVVVFSEPINPATAANIRLLSAGAPVSGSVAVTADGLRAAFTPSILLAANTEHVLSVPSTVTDVAGDALEQPVEVAFTTGTAVAMASVFTEQAALVTNPSNGALRAFDMSAAMDADGRVSGYFSIFYPESGARTAGRVTCFTIVDGTWAWVAGVAEESGNPSNVGIEYAWRVADNSPLGGGVPDQLSLAQVLDPAIPGSTAQEWCATTPLKPPGYNGDLIAYNLLGGGIVVAGATVPPPPPPPSAAGLSQIAYFAGPGGIQVMPADGSTGWPLTSARNDFNPAWSPDGTRLAFQSDRAEQGNWDIWVISWDRSGLTRLTGSPETDQDPAWSPDGTRLAFLRNGSIHVMNADGSNVTRVSNAGYDSHPSWAPDGARIVFASTRSGAHAIHVMNADGSGVVQLTSDSASDYSPTWSPDGTRIAFARQTQQANEGGYVINADGSGLRRLTLGINGHASWSPDGTRLVYELFGINVISVDGMGMTRIGSGFNPVWSPVGAMPPAPMPFRSVEMAGGDTQTGAVGTTLAQPLSVRVVRDDGTPEPGVTIRWNMWGVRPPNPPSLSSALATTDASGIASVQLTLGGSLGTVRVRAALTDGTARTGEVVFTATATAGAPVALCCGGDYGLAASGWSWGYEVTVRDVQGNSVPGIPITWAVTAGGGSITPTQDTTAYEPNSGQVAYSSAVHTIGPDEGTARVTATAPTIAGSPQVTFTHDVVTAIVSVFDGYFSPDSVAVPSGRTVAWVWEYGSNVLSHNVTFEDDPTEPTSSPTQAAGTFTRTFGGGPRTIRYRCTLHSTSFAEGEVGRVIVQ